MNKIGLHIIESWDGNLGTPRLVKLAEVSPGYVREIRRRVGPRCIIVVRWVAGDQYPLDNPTQRAQEWVERYRLNMQAMSEGDPNVVFEGYNEIDNGKPDTADCARRYCAFEVERLRLMHEAGLRSCVGNWSPGQPHESFWPELLQPLLKAMRPGDFLGLHEYWGIHGEIDMPYLCGRWKWGPVAPYLQGVPIIVSEIGRGEGGWLGPHRISPEQYLSELEKYNAIMEASPNVLGGCVFTAQGYGWQDYHPDAIWPQVVGRYTGAAWTDPSLQPVPAPAPVQDYYQSERHGYKPAWIILHDTEGSAESALAWWRSPDNPGKSSAHYLITSDSKVVTVVPEAMAAHHAGGGSWPGIPAGSVAGTSIINLASIGIELEYPAAPASPAWPEVQLEAAAKLVADIAQRYGIPRERVLRHSDVDPKNRTDPRNFDWQGFLDAVFAEEEQVNEQTIRNAAWQALGIAYNPDAAFPRYAREKGLGNPVTAEVDVGDVRLQGFSGGIVWARIDHWSECRHIDW